MDGPRRRLPAPHRLAADLHRVDRDALAGCAVRAVALVEQGAEVEGAPPMLTMRELVEDPDGTGPVLTLIDRTPGDGAQRTTRWRTVATRFEDTVTFFPILEQPEIWRLVNLAEDTHPIHVHLDAFLGARPPPRRRRRGFDRHPNHGGHCANRTDDRRPDRPRGGRQRARLNAYRATVGVEPRAERSLLRTSSPAARSTHLAAHRARP
jgi:FtsP/CotA-like multicopper oxidase with cupredoxin domain